MMSGHYLEGGKEEDSSTKEHQKFPFGTAFFHVDHDVAGDERGEKGRRRKNEIEKPEEREGEVLKRKFRGSKGRRRSRKNKLRRGWNGKNRSTVLCNA